MSKMTKIKCLVTGELKVNTFIVINDNNVIVIDPGGDSKMIIKTIEQYSNIAVLLTHSHYDHIGAINEVMSALPQAKLYAHEKCIELAADSATNISQFLLGVEYALSYTPEQTLKNKEKLQIGDVKIIPLHSTGHSRGHLCYYLLEENVVFCGDLLTAEDIGRHDVPGSNLEEMIEDCREMIKNVAVDTVIYPGHGKDVTVSQVLSTNSYLKCGKIC